MQYFNDIHVFLYPEKMEVATGNVLGFINSTCAKWK